MRNGIGGGVERVVIDTLVRLVDTGLGGGGGGGEWMVVMKVGEVVGEGGGYGWTSIICRKKL